MTTTATATAPPTTPSPSTSAEPLAGEAVALLDRRLAEWGHSGRMLVPASEVVDLALDLRQLLTRRSRS